VFNILLQVLDDGRLTDNKGRTVNFKNTIIIMTSNIGSDIIQKNFEHVDESNLIAITETTKIEVVERLKLSVRPEFLNRIDDIVMFKPLLKKQIRAIVDLQLNLTKKLLAEKEIGLVLTDKALDWLGEQGYEPQYGARPLKRLIQKEVVNALSKKILSGEVRKGQSVLIDEENGVLVFTSKEN
jgi:ATP-dependent Clp protease ATP-binding subunit ClpB